jgi:YegS/Rv2252/BmrU family lipid kinase
MIKGLLLYNPKSGEQSIPAKLDYVIERFESHNIRLTLYRLFQNESTAEDILEMIHAEPYAFILLFGGDGSLNFIANLMLKNGISLPLGVFPAGTCNDFARNIGMPNDLEQWIDMVLAGNTRYVDAGCINDHHYFMGNLGGGIFANVSFKTGNDLKKNLGPVAYYLKALDQLPNIEAFDLTVDIDNRHIEEKVILFLVLNGKNVAGFSNFFKDADVTDGMIDILLFKNARPMELAGIFMKMMAGELSSDRHIIHLRSKEVRIQSDRQLQISVDGEKGTILPIKVQCIHPGIRLFIGA